MIKQNLCYVDLVVELLDARIPFSSQNPLLKQWVGNKPVVVVLNKSDMADPDVTNRWIAQFQRQGIHAAEIHCSGSSDAAKVVALIKNVLQEQIHRRSQRGMSGKIIRVMIVGIPNVGKSTFINRVAKEKRARAENRPGVTRAKQWVHLQGDIDLLDMPGTLWPKFDHPDIGLHLAYTGAIKDDILDLEFVAMHLLEYLSMHYSAALAKRYSIGSLQNLEPFEKLKALGKARGMLMRGGEIDTERAANMLLDEFRSGKLGRITLEMPEAYEA